MEAPGSFLNWAVARSGCGRFGRSTAADRCRNERRKTLNGEDLLWAMQSLGFDSYYDPMRLYLQRYREVCLAPCEIE